MLISFNDEKNNKCSEFEVLWGTTQFIMNIIKFSTFNFVSCFCFIFLINRLFLWWETFFFLSLWSNFFSFYFSIVYKLSLVSFIYKIFDLLVLYIYTQSIKISLLWQHTRVFLPTNFLLFLISQSRTLKVSRYLNSLKL